MRFEIRNQKILEPIIYFKEDTKNVNTNYNIEDAFIRAL